MPYQLSTTGGLGYELDANGDPIQIRPGLGTVNTGATLGGVLGGSLGLFNGLGVDSNAGATTSANLREFETNLVPQFEASSERFQAQFQYEFDNDMTLTVLGSYNDNFREFTDDYNKGVGTVGFNIIPGLAPDLDGDGDGDFIGGPAGGLNIPIDTRLRAPADTLLATDNSSSDFETTSYEVRLQSDFDGPWNFTAGVLNLNSEGETNYYVFFNTAEALALATGLPGDRTYFRSRSPYELDAFGAFGEVYYEPSDTLKWTLGLRYTSDDKTQLNTPSLLLDPRFPGELNGEVTGDRLDPTLPAVQNAEFNEVTGRFGFDKQFDNTLLYASYSRGYKGGGINPPQSAGLNTVGNTFDPEFINAYEIGTKSSIFDGAGILNLAAFYYDYEGYQISSIINRTSVNQNVDAEVFGFEGEFYVQVTDRFRVDSTIGLLDATLKDQDPLLDTYDQTGGDPNFVVVKDPNTTQNCIADLATVNALNAAVGGTPLAGVVALICNPAALNATLAGALGQATADALTPEVREGNPVDVSGNNLPRAPELTVSVGAQYEWDMSNDWTATLRGDFYHQAEMFSRIFNLEADRIDSFQNRQCVVDLP